MCIYLYGLVEKNKKITRQEEKRQVIEIALGIIIIPLASRRWWTSGVGCSCVNHKPHFCIMGI